MWKKLLFVLPTVALSVYFIVQLAFKERGWISEQLEGGEGGGGVRDQVIQSEMTS